MKSIYINDELKGNVLHPEEYDVDSAYHKVPLGLITKYHVKNIQGYFPYDIQPSLSNVE